MYTHGDLRVRTMIVRLHLRCSSADLHDCLTTKHTASIYPLIHPSAHPHAPTPTDVATISPSRPRSESQGRAEPILYSPGRPRSNDQRVRFFAITLTHPYSSRTVAPTPTCMCYHTFFLPNGSRFCYDDINANPMTDRYTRNMPICTCDQPYVCVCVCVSRCGC